VPRSLEKCSAVAEMGDRLAGIDMVEKRGLLCPFLRRAGSLPNIRVKTSRRKISKNTKFIVYFMLALVNIAACTFLATFELFCQASIALPSKNAFALH